MWKLIANVLKTFVITLLLFAYAHADQPARTWKFDLKTAGAYKIPVQHDIGETVPGTKVTFSITIGTETRTRQLDLVANRPYFPLMADIPSPQKMSVVISGLSRPVLEHTRVDVYEANSAPPREHSYPTKSFEFKEIAGIRKILDEATGEFDLAKVNLTIDRIVDPAIDIDSNLKKIDAMVATIRAMPEFGTSGASKLLALQRYIYARGQWNEFRPFEYDMDDPFGANIKNKLLSNYLVSRKGNCVTMPFLFIILGQRLGIDLTASTAPKHVLVKWRNEGGTWINLEATSGAAPARDVWIRQQIPMTDEALANGVYMQPLTRKETAALMVITVAEFYFQREEYEKAIAISDLVLEHYPKHVGTMTLKASACARLMRKHFVEKYPSPNLIPPPERAYFEYLSRNNQQWFAKAEALGWREETKVDEEKYLQHIDQIRQPRIAN